MRVFKTSQIAREPKAEQIFTGPVTMQTIIGPDQSDRFVVRQVNFNQGVRNKFHSHDIEQILIVTEGKGIIATEKEKTDIVPGDIVFIPAGEKHWHGAAEGSTFSHLYVMSPDSNTTQIED